MKIEYVAQPNDYGCAIACCAMVLGKTYEETEAALAARGHKGGAIYECIWEQFMHEHGFALTRKYYNDSIRGVPRDEWPPKPWAPVHIALLQATAGFHAVVMLADGTVLDPFDRSRTTLHHPDYKKVDFVMGFHRIRDELPADIIAALRAGREDDELLPGEAGALRRVMQWMGVETK